MLRENERGWKCALGQFGNNWDGSLNQGAAAASSEPILKAANLIAVFKSWIFKSFSDATASFTANYTWFFNTATASSEPILKAAQLISIFNK